MGTTALAQPAQAAGSYFSGLWAPRPAELVTTGDQCKVPQQPFVFSLGSLKKRERCCFFFGKDKRGKRKAEALAVIFPPGC